MAVIRTPMIIGDSPQSLIPHPQFPERPGWIPAAIIQDWDPDPYAYQTEEEMMPGGGLHGQLLAYIVELVRHVLAQRGLMFLIDTFLLYRDEAGIKQRIAPDLLLMPRRFPPPSAYDLDDEPPPRFVVEVTSPSSHVTDLEDKVPFYLGLGIASYLVIDAITPSNRLRRRINLQLWRNSNGQPQRIEPDEDDGFALPEVGLRIFTEGQEIFFVDLVTGETLLDSSQLQNALASERRERLAEREARLAEQAARRKAEAELAQLREELRKLRGEE